MVSCLKLVLGTWVAAGRPRLPGIVDLRDGGFKLPPNPNAVAVRLRKWSRRGFVGLALVTVAAGVNFLIHRGPAAQWTERLEVIGMPLAAAACLWILMESPALRVTKAHVSFGVTWPFRLYLQRSDLAYIFRGLARMRPSYFLVTRDDTPRITITAENFTDDGMAELAKRLEVPIKGDFSAPVRARFD